MERIAGSALHLVDCEVLGQLKCVDILQSNPLRKKELLAGKSKHLTTVYCVAGKFSIPSTNYFSHPQARCDPLVLCSSKSPLGRPKEFATGCSARGDVSVLQDTTTPKVLVLGNLI